MIYLKCVPNYVGGKRCLSSFSTHIVQAQGWLRLQDTARVRLRFLFERFDWMKGYENNLKVSLCCQLNLFHTFVKPSSTEQATLIHIGL